MSLERMFKIFAFYAPIYFLTLIFAQAFALSSHLQELRIKERSDHAMVDRPSHVLKTLIIDQTFDLNEKEFIVRAAQAWSKATNNIVQFNFVMLPNINSRDIILDDDTLYITRVEPNYPQIMVLELNNSSDDDNCILGYYDQYTVVKSILIVASRLDDLSYESVVMHELGHALGIKHIVNDPKALMFPSIGTMPARITSKDLIQFCLLYDCSNLEKH